MHPSSTQILENLRSRLSEYRSLLTTWCDINSGSAHPEGLARMLDALEARLCRIPGLQCTRLPLPGTPAQALSCVFRPRAPLRILCLGHYDTVYPLDHPFQRCTPLPDGRLGGPGTADMKGGIVVALAALEAYETLRRSENLGWELLLTPDEETGSLHSHELIRAAAARHHLGLVFEPARANGDLVRSRMGTGTFRVVSRGRSAHAAQPSSAGRNAIVALCEFLQAAHRLPETIPGCLVNVATIQGGSVVNVVPDHAEALLNIRVASETARTQVLSALETLAAPIRAREGHNLLIEGSFDRPPKECTPLETSLFSRYQQAARFLGLPIPSWQDAGGGSDGNLLHAAGLPNLDGLGIIGEHLHSDQERCTPSSLPERAALAVLLLCDLELNGLPPSVQLPNPG